MRTCLLSAALLFLGGAQGFITSLPRLPTRDITPTPGRCRVPRLALTPPRKPNTGAGAGSAAAGGDDNGGANDVLKSTSGITRAPLRITPNFQPQEKRRPKFNVDKDVTYGAFLTEESFDIAAMAWEEFSDFLRRTVERNLNGAQFDFDTRQWSSSIRKWWSRAVEMDVQAKADLFRLYDSSVGQRDARGNQALKVDARVEDEWDSIYVDCQDVADVDFQDWSFDSSISGGVEGAATGSDVTGWRSSESSSEALPSSLRKEGGGWGASPGSASTGGSRSALMAAMDAFQEEEEAEEGEEEGTGSEGFDDEEIIDCAIRGRWTFTNNDDPGCFEADGSDAP
ncbi:expressed unknown protein [Ectocarpus siliculosus]|uniref:Uncharacterized protein n=1 Tax=Ectocarpus siliculosus TaxID=2880 RepID=D7G502_ECTSI|nr:expressed unknown protein [Ectocarpus siliculosus]|eukprot:CBJ33765.1 expressed unknown protein [Ectocarpus siliculosus]